VGLERGPLRLLSTTEELLGGEGGADANSEQGLQGLSATSEEAQTDSIASGATINVESYRLIIEILHPYRKGSGLETREYGCRDLSR
jgi:hypothetical protein